MPHIFVGKLLEDQGDRVILEVPKNLDTGTFDIKGGEQFYTIVFIDRDHSYNPFVNDTPASKLN